MTGVDVAAQINLYPMDSPHVEHLLEHQIRTWEPMVDRIVLTVDTYQSRSGRYRGSQFDSNLRRLQQQMDEAKRKHPKLYISEVDYSVNTQREVADFLFGMDTMPIKAWDGGPFYAYFFGLWSARARYVIHFDGDMMFGGGSTHWVDDARDLMNKHPDVLLTAPFPGPPREDRAIYGHLSGNRLPPRRELWPTPAYRFIHASTRIFMIDLDRFMRRVHPMVLTRPPLRRRLKSRLLGNPPDVLEAEVVLSHTLQRTGMLRVDMLGSTPGLWSLHSPYRSPEFYRRLPELVRAVESGNVPDGQRGDYDLNDSMIDWTGARAASRWYRRYARMARDRLLPARIPSLRTH